ncbi:transposase, partial [Staphylococcus aureus]|uniref:transposase n=1 Tax=Staphylococcus aureus TaxID=1280 RepID=UPI003A7FF732
VEAEQYYGAWENSVSDDVAWAFKDLRTAMKNWRPEILNYFDHRVTNAFIESMNNLIRLMNRIGRGYRRRPTAHRVVRNAVADSV